MIQTAHEVGISDNAGIRSDLIQRYIVKCDFAPVSHCVQENPALLRGRDEFPLHDLPFALTGGIGKDLNRACAFSGFHKHGENAGESFVRMDIGSDQIVFSRSDLNCFMDSAPGTVLSVQEFVRRFKGHSAAKTVHHSFSGGLLEHTLSVVHLCEYFAGAYSILNRDLLIAAALCHDIGKTRELSAFPDNDYTDEGQLIGHIVIGVEMIDEALREQPDFPVKLANELKHCVVAHHGELEYGSPKKPALAEALALNLADNADAKLQTLTEIFKGKTGTEWLGFNRLFESNLRRTSGT